MQNPWKLTTLVLAAVLAISTARADKAVDWRADVLGHLESAAAILSSHGGSKIGKQAPDEKKKMEDASPASKALQLTRAAIVQMQRVGS